MKICPKCNAQFPDGTKFCNNCGTPLDDNAVSAGPMNSNPAPSPFQAAGQDNAQPPQAAPADGQAPQSGLNSLFSAPPVEEPKKKNFAPVVLGIACALIAIIAIVVIALLLGGGYKKPVKKLVSLVNSKSTDVNAYMNCVTPSFVGDTYKEALGLLKGGDAKSELNDTIKDTFDEAWDKLKDDYGKDWKVSVEFKKNKKLKDKEIDDIQDTYDSLIKLIEKMDIDDEDFWEEISDELDDEFDTELNTAKAAKMGANLLKKLDGFKVTDGYEVKVKVSIEGKDDKESETMTVNIIKAGGKWFIDPLSLSDLGVSASSLKNMINNIDF